jgi:hypothetical protein
MIPTPPADTAAPQSEQAEAKAMREALMDVLDQLRINLSQGVYTSEEWIENRLRAALPEADRERYRERI